MPLLSSLPLLSLMENSATLNQPIADRLALSIGNSRLHWAWFQADRIRATWDTPHYPAAVVEQMIATGLQFVPEVADLPLDMPLTIASVVPAQTQLWQAYPQAQVLQLTDIPLGQVYPTLGIDRALTLWGAIQTYGAPVLVIDGGTALTFTGADGDRNLVGGAILPGVRSLFQTLNRSTAALTEVGLGELLPDRWATNTPDAIRSGIIHTVTAGVREFIADWLECYPGSPIVFTGGDGELLLGWYRGSRSGGLGKPTPTGLNTGQTTGVPSLIFVGIQAVMSLGCPTADGN
jgi:type III pantothenate kinase